MNATSIKDFFRKNERATYTVLVIILLLVAAYFLMGGESVRAPSTGDLVDEENGVSLNEGSQVSVRDQEAGAQVVIDTLALAEKSWVVIHADKDGVPGGILGAARFRPENASGTVKLVVRNTEPGNTYYAMVHIDDGDDTFSYKTDVPLLLEGKEVMVMFKTTGATTTP